MLRTIFLIFVFVVPQISLADELDAVIDDLIYYRDEMRQESVLQNAAAAQESFFPLISGYVNDAAVQSERGGALSTSTTYYPSKKGTAFSVQLIYPSLEKQKTKMGPQEADLLLSMMRTYKKASEQKVFNIQGFPSAALEATSSTNGLVVRLGEKMFLIAKSNEPVAPEKLVQFVSELHLDHLKQAPTKSAQG